MNIIFNLLKQFFYEEYLNTAFMIITSFIINILQTNGISYVTAKIIDFIHKNKKTQVYNFYHAFIMISVAYIIVNYVYKHFQNKLLSNLRQWLRHQIVKIMLLTNNDNFSEMNFTKLYSPINRISYVCSMVFNDIIAYLLPNVAFLIIISTYFLYKDQHFGTGFIFSNLLFGVYVGLNWRDMLEKMEESERYVVETEGYLMEILNGIDKIVYRGQTLQEIDNFSKKTETSIDKVFRFYSNANYHGTIMSIMIYIIVCVSIGYLISLFFERKIDLTTFITFFTIILLYRDKMTIVVQQVPDFIEFLGRSHTLLVHFKDMENEYDRISNRTHEPKELAFDKIRFENVSFKYNLSEKTLFENLNVTINTHNKIIGMVGTSGKGKSTFMKLVLKLYTPKSGIIYIDEQNIENIDPDYIRSHLTYVNQNSKLFDKKIIDNILYGCLKPDVCNQYLKEIMQYKKIGELFKNIDIYNQQSGPLGENLSGGQRQIVNIIGGLINPSKILILDEPTNALDPELKRELIGLIKDFKKYKKCIIIITHDRDVHPLFDETVHI